MSNIETYAAAFVLSYLFGAVPGAYLIGKLFGKIDIRAKGTGNVGAMNTYEVTGRKSLGVAVLIIDAIKAAAAVLTTYYLIGKSFEYICISSSAALLGHNFNIFLKFRGGRGLASAAGISLLLNPFLLISWLLMYIAGIYAIKKHVHVGSITGTLFCCFLIYLTPDLVTGSMNLLIIMTKGELLILSGILCAAIMARHIGPLMALLKNQTNQ